MRRGLDIGLTNSRINEAVPICKNLWRICLPCRQSPRPQNLPNLSQSQGAERVRPNAIERTWRQTHIYGSLWKWLRCGQASGRLVVAWEFREELTKRSALPPSSVAKHYKVLLKYYTSSLKYYTTFLKYHTPYLGRRDLAAWPRAKIALRGRCPGPLVRVAQKRRPAFCGRWGITITPPHQSFAKIESHVTQFLDQDSCRQE